MKNKKIATTELDFDNIKTNLKTFLSGQSQFQDYDFEGSSLSILLDVLAYNTHYNALYHNLAVNEVFLDSAAKRSSVVSRAKEIGYIPGSAKCSTATINVIVTSTSSTPSSLVLPKNSRFITSIEGKQYNFYTLEDNIATLDLNNKYIFTNITIKEGAPLSIKYEVLAGQKYILPNIDTDLSTVLVRVQENSSSSSFTTFYRNEDLLTIGSSDPVYFVKEIDEELYELEFGNGVIGKALVNGNIVNISYFVSNKSIPNGAKSFTYSGSSLLGGIVSAVTVLPATGGVDKEDIDTIRYNAPRAYQSQNRGVTVNDYKSLILTRYDEAESVNVWGGEDNIPPIYGKVFISIKPKTSELLTSNQKIYVNSLLKTRNIVTITPEIVDPEYIDIELNTTAYYNPKNTIRTSGEISSLVATTIQDYNENYLNSFDGVFRFSQFNTFVDATEPSIVSSITTLKLRRVVEPKYNVLANYKIDLVNPIYHSGVPEESIITNGFYMAGHDEVMYLEDKPIGNGLGTFRIFYYDINLIKQYLDETIGTITYSTGSIDIQGLTVTGIAADMWDFIIKPQSYDVVSIRNQLIRIPPEHTTINIIIDKVSTGDSAGNANYIFTSSRN